jgi:hypothetical protein
VSDRVETLPLSERIEVYRRRAARMLRLARHSESQGIRLAYLKLAAHWQDLIVSLEQSRAVKLEEIESPGRREPTRRTGEEPRSSGSPIKL